MKKHIFKLIPVLLISAAAFLTGCSGGTGNIVITLDRQALKSLVPVSKTEDPKDYFLSASINGAEASAEFKGSDLYSSKSLVLENVPVGTGRLKISLGKKGYPVYIKSTESPEVCKDRKILYGYNKDIMVSEGENNVSVTLEAYTSVFLSKYSTGNYDLFNQNNNYNNVFFAEPDYQNHENVSLPGIDYTYPHEYIGYAFDEKGVLYYCEQNDSEQNGNFPSITAVDQQNHPNTDNNTISYSAEKVSVSEDFWKECSEVSCFAVGHKKMYFVAQGKKIYRLDISDYSNKESFILDSSSYYNLIVHKITPGEKEDHLYMAWSYDNKDNKKQYCVSSVFLNNQNNKAELSSTAELGEILDLIDERENNLLTITDLIYKDGSVWVLVKENTDNDSIELNEKNTLFSRGAVVQLSPDTLKQGVYGWTDISTDASVGENEYAFFGQSDLSSEKFISPERFCGVRPGELVINEAGKVYDSDSKELKNAVRLVTFDLNTKKITVNYKNSNKKYITFKSLESFSMTVSNKGWNGTVEYSKDAVLWNEWDGINVSAEKSSEDGPYCLYFRGQRNTKIAGDNNYKWSIDKTAECSGNIMTLLDYENPDCAIMENNCFKSMFSGCAGLTSAPELPAMNLAESCYSGMFVNCTGLTSAPELPATTMIKSCYSSMFYGCAGLTSAPELPAMNLANCCYSSMFSGCTGLNEAPELPAKTLADCCYSGMFSGCTLITSAPELPAMNLAESCYSTMFSGCTGLTSAPELPALTLAESCYSTMFSRCTGLNEVPELPATTMIKSCYSDMFSGCTNLNYIKMMATDISAGNCLNSWVQDVADDGIFVKNSAATWEVSGINGIPSKWDVITAEE